MHLLGVKRYKYVLLRVLLQGQAVVGLPKRYSFKPLVSVCIVVIVNTSLLQLCNSLTFSALCYSSFT